MCCSEKDDASSDGVEIVDDSTVEENAKPRKIDENADIDEVKSKHIEHDESNKPTCDNDGKVDKEVILSDLECVLYIPLPFIL